MDEKVTKGVKRASDVRSCFGFIEWRVLELVTLPVQKQDVMLHAKLNLLPEIFGVAKHSLCLSITCSSTLSLLCGNLYLQGGFSGVK